MKYLGLFVILLIVACFWYAGKISEKAFEDCMAAGVQSEDTCRFYAYQ